MPRDPPSLAMPAGVARPIGLSVTLLALQFVVAALAVWRAAGDPMP